MIERRANDGDRSGVEGVCSLSRDEVRMEGEYVMCLEVRRVLVFIGLF